jgi:hypothetical protein
MGHGAAAQHCGAISLGTAVAASVVPSHPHRQRGKVAGLRCGATSAGAATADTAHGPALLSPSSTISNRHLLVLVYRRIAAAAPHEHRHPLLLLASCCAPPPSAIPAAPYQPLGRRGTGPLHRSGRRPSLPLASCTSSGPIPAALQGNGCFPIRI